MPFSITDSSLLGGVGERELSVQIERALGYENEDFVWSVAISSNLKTHYWSLRSLTLRIPYCRSYCNVCDVKVYLLHS